MKSTEKQLANLNRKGWIGTKVRDKITFSINIEKSVCDEIDRTAELKGISRSAEVRHRLGQYKPEQIIPTLE